MPAYFHTRPLASRMSFRSTLLAIDRRDTPNWLVVPTCWRPFFSHHAFHSAYSVELPDGRIAWIYSDTFLGEVDEDHGRPLDSMFIHNSINVDDDGAITTFTGGTPESPESLVTVSGGDEGKDWYWFGDATVHGDELQVMLDEIIDRGVSSGVFDTPYPGDAGRAIASMCAGVATWYRPEAPLSFDPLLDRYLSIAEAIVGVR